MNYIQLSIKANEADQELLIGMLSLYAPTGFEQTGNNLVVYFEEDHFESYEVNEILKGYSYEKLLVKEENWNAIWESNFQPVIIDNFCGIRAHFHESIKDVQHEIIITPKMSFGTGHHATTHMMVQHLSEIEIKDKSVFDFGTGTGILAILAQKLGAASVLAIDNDEWSIKNAIENSEQNHCHHIDFQLTSEVPNLQFEVIVANINKNVLLSNVLQLKNAACQNAMLLLSGLLEEDEQDISNAFEQNGFVFVSKKNRHNWISLLYRNKG